MLFKSLSSSSLPIALLLFTQNAIGTPVPTLAQAENLNPIATDTRFSDRPFSKQVYWYVPWWDNACPHYGLSRPCSYRRTHQFQDATLTMEANSTVYANATLDPKQPISVEQGIEYGRILSRDRMELDRPSEQNRDRVVYDETGISGGGNVLELMLHESGQVDKVIYTVVTP